MSFKTVINIVRFEIRMQMRRKYVWIITALILFVLWFLLSPFNEPGMLYSADELAPHSLELNILFSSLLMGFLVSGRLLRDDYLNVRECIMSKPVKTSEYILGKLLGNTLYCIILFILPVFLMVQLEQIYYGGMEYYSWLPFLKAYSFFPFFSCFFIVGLSLCLATVLRDPMKFFILFTILWAAVFFLSVSDSGSFLGIINFTGNSVMEVLFPGKYGTVTGKDYFMAAMNLSFLAGVGILSAVGVSAYLSGEYSTPHSIIRKRDSVNESGNSRRAKSMIWYNRKILKWDSFKGSIALVILFFLLLIIGAGSRKESIARFYFEVMVPFIFSFTTTHVVMHDKNLGVLELVLSKPVSRISLLLKRYLLLILPSIFAVIFLVLGITNIFPGLELIPFMAATLVTVVFMCTLSMSVGMITGMARSGAAFSALWLIIWMVPDIQDKIGTSGICKFINPFMYTYHSDASFLLINKLVLLIASCFLFIASVIILNKSERLI